jgi:hypothetical protein
VRFLGIPLLASLIIATAPAPAAAAVGADLLQLNTSVRGAGMGESGVAVHWGGDPGLWSNPAMAIYQKGLRFSSMESQLLPGAAPDVMLKDERVTVGLDWFGVMFARGPVEGTRLGMSVPSIIPEVDAVESWMRAEQVGVGVDAVRLLEGVAGGDSGFSRMFGLSAGYTHIDYSDRLNVDEVLDDVSSEAEGSARSYGGLARFTPLNTVGPTHASGPLGGVRLSLAYGMSVINDSEDLMRETDLYPGDVFPRRYLRGWSVHVETGFPPDFRRGFRKAGLGWIVESLTPLVSFGYTDQVSEPGVKLDAAGDYFYGHDTSGHFDITSTGWELTVANIWSVRRGHYDGPDGLGGDTEGASLGFELDGVGGARWDKATVPLPGDLGETDRESWTVWIDLAGLLD